MNVRLLLLIYITLLLHYIKLMDARCRQCHVNVNIPFMNNDPSELRISGKVNTRHVHISSNITKENSSIFNQYHYKRANKNDPENDLALWINEEQVKILSGFSIKVYAISFGRVNTRIKDSSINHNLPTIPSEVNNVNFTWRSGSRKYYYHFDRLESLDKSILKPPTVSIKLQGKIPHYDHEFSVLLPCTLNATGTAIFSIGLLINTRRGAPLPGTPIRLTLRKECAPRGVYDTTSTKAPDPECDKTCANNGWCNADKICQCPQGFMGTHCQMGLCFPQCMHGGNCTAPGICSCPPGYQGEHCEGGICTEKCLNGGKCYQKDKCQCPKGYYGLRCEFSKCVIPCMNNGKCIGNNKCRCTAGFAGKHCEIGHEFQNSCEQCFYGKCDISGKCLCESGWRGRKCNQQIFSKDKQSQWNNPVN